MALKKNNPTSPGRRFQTVSTFSEITRKNTPSCTTCSRYILKKEIGDFVLICEDGFALYPAEEFNRLSHEYHEN